MRRRSGGTSMAAAEWKRVWPSSTILRESGLANSARILISVVLPAPERPKRASRPLAGPLNSAAKWKSPSILSAANESMALARNPPANPARQNFRGDQGHQSQHDGDDRKPQGGEIALRILGQRVDGDGDCPRLARDIAHENDGGAEFAQAAGKRKYGPDQQAG